MSNEIFLLHVLPLCGLQSMRHLPRLARVQSLQRESDPERKCGVQNVKLRSVIFNLLNTAPTLLGRPDAVLVQLVVQRAAGEAHTPGRFGLRSVRVRKHT